MRKNVTPISAREFVNAAKLPSPTRGVGEGQAALVGRPDEVRQARIGRQARHLPSRAALQVLHLQVGEVGRGAGDVGARIDP